MSFPTGNWLWLTSLAIVGVLYLFLPSAWPEQLKKLVLAIALVIILGAWWMTTH